MAALTRATKANYVIHDRIEAETTDREDHTFCGIMFPIKCKETLPIDHVVVHSVAVRGALGPLTVWVTNEAVNGEISMSKRHWTKIYQKTHAPSFVAYAELKFDDDKPIVMRPGDVRGVYVHSTLRGDEAIVYDNKEKRKTHDDSFITVLPGRAHVSEKAFGSVPIWGWGSAWRDNREFVGQIKYGACYRLWNPSENVSFGENFRSAARILFLCQRRRESPFSTLPDDCLFYILHMMRWDWVNDTSAELRREQKRRRRHRRIAEAQVHMMEQEAEDEEEGAQETEMDDAEEEDVAAAAAASGAEEERYASDAVLGVDEEEEADVDMEEEDSSDDSEDADSSDDEESVASDEYAWGDHVSSRNQFVYNDEESSDSDADDGTGEQADDGTVRRRRTALLRARRSILQFLRHH